LKLALLPGGKLATGPIDSIFLDSFSPNFRKEVLVFFTFTAIYSCKEPELSSCLRRQAGED
jgi:hypothetical protein